MIVACPACAADLRVNRNLAGTKMSCPQCGDRFVVPAAAPEGRPPAAAPTPTRSRRSAEAPKSTRSRRPQTKAGAPAPMSLSLLGAQTLLVVMAVVCFLSAFFRSGWDPPAVSFMGENELLLTGVGIGLLVASAAARRYPITATLAVVLAVLVLCALHYRSYRVVDASRVLALSLSMVALWLAMEHRGVT